MLYLVFHSMARFPKVFLGLLVAAGVTIAGCNGSTPTDVATPTEEPTTAISEAEAPASEKGDETTADKPPVEVQPNQVNAAEDKMVAVSIYVMDDSCTDFKAESVQVPADQAMTKAVGALLDRHSFDEFKLSGYRVNIEDSKAIVDLRLAEDSERQFLSLSSCEQQGLFGGLEETLRQNSNWKVDQVEFTNRGKEIIL